MQDLTNLTSRVLFRRKLVKDVLLQTRGIIQEKDDNEVKEGKKRTQVTSNLQDDDEENLREGSWQQPG